MDFLHRTWAEIDINALVHNFEIIKKQTENSAIMAVVKANAYGHSVCDVAPVLQDLGADSFAVSNIDEALQLRECGITKPILILGYTPTELTEILHKNDISQCVYSLEYATALSKKLQENNQTLKIHIKLDTGMSRLGFDCRNNKLCGIDSAVRAAALDGFELEGVFTHFALSDRKANNDKGFTNEQFERFKRAVNILKKNGLSPKIVHTCNSAAIFKDNDKHLDMCRPGIILYGLEPANIPEFKKDLIPVMTLKSVVSMVKEIKRGDTVSYGRTFKAKKDMKIATVAAGYADGYPRALSNKACVLINGKRAKILGRICMDQLCVDVTNLPDVKMGDEVILFGKELSVNELAEICKTINYEIVCGISPRVPRIIKGKII